MICAVADRIQDADRWLTGHLEFPKDCVRAQTFYMLLAVEKVELSRCADGWPLTVLYQMT